MIRINGVVHEFEPKSVRALIDSLLPSDKGIAVAINGEVVRKSLWEETLLADNDSVEVVTAVAGG